MNAQTAMFISSLLLGGVIGVLFDVFRITRVAFKLSKVLIMLEDILFFLISAVLLFQYFLELSGGEVRIFAVMGVFLGWVIYFFTLGSLVLQVSGWMIGVIIKLLTILWTPIGILMGLIKECGAKLVKLLINYKKRLKSQLHLLYNNYKQKRGRGGKRLWHGKKAKKDVPPWTR